MRPLPTITLLFQNFFSHIEEWARRFPVEYRELHHAIQQLFSEYHEVRIQMSIKRSGVPQSQIMDFVYSPYARP